MKLMKGKIYLLAVLMVVSVNLAVAGSKNPYLLDPNWPSFPEGISIGQATGVAVDSHNHVFLFHRANREWVEPFPDKSIPQDTIYMLDGVTGELIDSWGGDLFIMPHGLSVDPDDNVWVTDVGSQQIHKFSHEGELLMSIGETGVQGADENHFALPSDLSITNDGSIFVSDGYVNTRIIKFTSSGIFEMQWGSPGTQEGEFDLPHGIAASRNQIYVADRANSRIQVFDYTGLFIAEWKGEDIGRPYGVATYHNGNLIVIDGGDQPDKTRSRVVILNTNGEAIQSFSAEKESDQENLGHDIAVGNDGAIYVVDAWARSVRKYILKD